MIDHDASLAGVACARFAGTTDRGVPVVALAGELDLVSHAEVVRRLGTVLRRLGPDLVVDLTGVTFCDSRGLSALVRVATRARGHGGRLMLTGVPPRVEGLLRITHLHDAFQVTPHSVN